MAGLSGEFAFGIQCEYDIKRSHACMTDTTTDKNLFNVQSFLPWAELSHKNSLTYSEFSRKIGMNQLLVIGY